MNNTMDPTPHQPDQPGVPPPPGLSPPGMVPPGPGQPSGWPTGIGVVSIVLAACGLACYGCGSINVIATPFMMKMVPPEQAANMPPPAQGMQLFIQIFSTCSAALLSGWLLFAGIGLTRRRSWSRGHHLGWAVAKVIVSLIGLAVGIAFANAGIQQINDAIAQAGMTFEVTTTIFAVFAAMQTIVLLVWPAFLLIWFSRDSIKQEVAGWEKEEGVAI